MESEKAKVKKKAVDARPRVTLDADVNKRLDNWIDQVDKSMPLVTVKKHDLVNMFLRFQPIELREKELNEIEDKFFDSIRALEQMASDLRSNGANEQIENFIREKFARHRKKRGPNKKATKIPSDVLTAE